MEKNSKLDKIIFFLYSSLLLFTPLVMASATSELFEFNKMIFIYIVTTLVMFFWLLKMILFKKIIIKKTPFDIPIILFLLSQILATIFSIDRYTSFFGYYGRFNGGLLSIITYIILFYGFVSNIAKEKIESLLTISLLASAAVVIWGLPGKLGYDFSCFVFMGQLNNSCWTDQFKPAERMFSTLGQPNWFGAYLAINFFAGVYFLLKNLINTKYSIRYTLYLLLSFSAILFSRSRSALAAVVVGLILFTIYYLLFIKTETKKLIISLFLITAIPVLIFKTGIEKVDHFLKFPNNSPISNNQLPISPANVTESFDIRKIVWKGAIDLAIKYPFFGTGVETFAYSYYSVRPKEHNLTSEWDYLYNKAHNEFLNYLATTGFIGLGAYLLMIGVVIFIVLKKITNYQLPITNQQLLITCLLLSYLTILITNFFGFSTTTVNLFFYLIPAFLVANGTTLIRSYQSGHVGNISLSQKFSIVFLSLFIFYLLSSIFRYWYADTLYAKADNLSKAGQYQSSVNLLTQALQFRYEHVYEDKLSYLLANLAALASYQKQSELTKKLITASQFYNQKSLLASPQNILYLKTKAKIYYLFYQITLQKKDLEQGVTALASASSLSPTDPKIPYSLSIFYSLLADEQKKQKEKEFFQNRSLQEAENSIILKNNYRDGYFLKGQLLKKYGKKEEAKKTFQFILDKISSNDNEIRKELESF